MCVQCKIDDRHKHCPKDTVPASTEFPITDIDLKKSAPKMLRAPLRVNN